MNDKQRSLGSDLFVVDNSDKGSGLHHCELKWEVSVKYKSVRI